MLFNLNNLSKNNYFTDDQIWQYCLMNTTNISHLLIDIEQEEKSFNHNINMVSGKMVAKIMQFFLRLQQPKLCIDIGTYLGFSACAIAEVTSSETQIHTIDRKNQKACKIAKKYIDDHYHNKIIFHENKADFVIPHLPNHIDFVFIDADKKNTKNYFNLLLPKLSNNALIIVDDVLWRGQVIYKNDDGRSKALDDFNQYIFNHPECDNIILPIRHGLNIIYYNKILNK